MNAQSFHAVYRRLLSSTLYNGVEERNERTGRSVKSIGVPCSMLIDLRDGWLPVPGNRKVYPGTAAAELAWCLMGHRHTLWLKEQGCHIWDKFLVEGELNLRDAYGWRWRHAFGRDQIALLVKALQADPSDRRTWVSTWDPSVDGLGAPLQPTVPCPVGWGVTIQADHVNIAVVLRSSDIFVGLPYDVMVYSLLLDSLSTMLGYKPGHLHVTLVHPHLYDANYDDAAASLRSGPDASSLLLPGWDIGEIVVDPRAYVTGVRDAAKKVSWPQFNPRPEVIE